MLLDGKKIAWEIYETLSQSIITLHSKPCLWAVLVWENAASMRYIRQKQKFAKEIWMDFQLFQFETTITEKKLWEEIQKLNLNENISGYIVQLPLPQHISPTVIISIINPKKDVDWFHPENLGKIMIWDPSGLAPCTPAGIMKIFEYYDISLAGKHIVILWRSNIVGKPLALMCINAGATVSSCNSKTPHISTFTLIADIVVCATGQKHILTSRMIWNDCIVIDVWFSIENENIYGDADFEAISANWNDITPVPGWVGPMTVAMLLSNTVAAHERNTKK
jgi:methylenetetrahydrofolate dehydrogenase (NADP+)/methenyltetrahydrofolate cyclohydrolase